MADDNDIELALIEAQEAEYRRTFVPPVPLPDDVLRAAAASDDVSVRWQLGAYPFVLPADVFLALIDDPEEAVRESTVRHWAATTTQLELALALRPEVEERLIFHDHAPRRLMDRRPVGVTDGPLRQHYLDQHGASEAERCKFQSLCNDCPNDEQLTVTLGDLWEIVHTA